MVQKFVHNAQGTRTLHGVLSEASTWLHFVYQPNWITIVEAHIQMLCADRKRAMFQWWKQRPDLSRSSCAFVLCFNRWVLKVFFFSFVRFSIELQRKREFSRFCGFTEWTNNHRPSDESTRRYYSTIHIAIVRFRLSATVSFVSLRNKSTVNVQDEPNEKYEQAKTAYEIFLYAGI